MEINSYEESMFLSCFWLFIDIVGRRSAIRQVLKLVKLRREEPYEPIKMEGLLRGRFAEGCEEALRRIEADRCRKGMRIDIENLNLFIESDEVMDAISALSPKLLESLILGVCFDLDNASIAKRMNIKKSTAKVYKAKALNLSSRKRRGRKK